MNPFTMNPAELVGLDAVVITEKLKTRRIPRPDRVAENRAVVALTERMARAPRSILQTLADVTVEFCPSQSAGISLLTQDRKRFYWAAVSGRWADHNGGAAPRDFGPCGPVLDCHATQLMWRPERHFTYFADARPAIEELLLVPLKVPGEGEAVGAIWAIVHDQNRRFDSEHSRLLNTLSRLAATAYQASCRQAQIGLAGSHSGVSASP